MLHVQDLLIYQDTKPQLKTTTNLQKKELGKRHISYTTSAHTHKDNSVKCISRKPTSGHPQGKLDKSLTI